MELILPTKQPLMHKLFCYLNSLGKTAVAPNISTAESRMFLAICIFWNGIFCFRLLHCCFQKIFGNLLGSREQAGITCEMENTVPNVGNLWPVHNHPCEVLLLEQQGINTNNPSVTKQIALLTESCLAQSADLAARKWYLNRWDLLKFPQHVSLCLSLAWTSGFIYSIMSIYTRWTICLFLICC